MQAVPGLEPMFDVPLDERERAVDDPDLMVDEGVGVRGIGHFRPGWQVDLNKLERAPARGREGTSLIAAVG